jgi:hypothetical protein
MAAHDPTSSRTAPLARPTGLRSNTVKDISGALNILLAGEDQSTWQVGDRKAAEAEVARLRGLETSL